jgi:hypothetical protein
VAPQDSDDAATGSRWTLKPEGMRDSSIPLSLIISPESRRTIIRIQPHTNRGLIRSIVCGKWLYVHVGSSCLLLMHCSVEAKHCNVVY